MMIIQLYHNYILKYITIENSYLNCNNISQSNKRSLGVHKKIPLKKKMNQPQTFEW